LVHVPSPARLTNEWTTIVVVGIAFDDGAGAVDQGPNVVHTVEHVVIRPTVRIPIHHQALIYIADAVDVVALPCAALIVFDQLVHAVIIITIGDASCVVNGLDPTPERIIGEVRQPVGIGAVIDAGQTVVMIPTVGVGSASIGRVGQRQIAGQIVALRFRGELRHPIRLVMGITDRRRSSVLVADPITQVIISIPRSDGAGRAGVRPVLHIRLAAGDQPIGRVVVIGAACLEIDPDCAGLIPGQLI